MTKILVLAGKKQSGKNTAANFVTGYSITQQARAGVPYLPTQFTIDEETGELIVSPPVDPSMEKQRTGEHILDLNDGDHEVQLWLRDCVHPHVKLYAFADMLKIAVATLFGVPLEYSNGTEEDKNRLTDVNWKDMYALMTPVVKGQIKKEGKLDKKMTVRELLQFFGTNVCRKIYDSCWVDACYRRIDSEQPEIAIISDCRFKNEVKASKEHGAKIVKLTRAPHSDTHPSEIDLDDLDDNNFDLILPPNVTIREQNQLLLDALYDWKWFDNHIELENE